MNRSGFKLILSLFSILLLFFILAPLTKLLTGSSAELVLTTLQEQKVYNSLLITFKASLVATVITLILGIPLAYLLARGDFPGKALVEGIINLPVIIPHTAAGIALLTVFGSQFFGGKFFSKLGIEFVSEFPGVVIGMMFVSLPFLINEAKEGFRSIDERLEKVSRTLGATPAQTFFKVALPLNLNHIISGSVMMWGRGLSEFGAVVILAYHPMTAPILIYERFTSYGLKYSKPIAIVMVLVTLSIFVGLRLLHNRGGRGIND
ncbi:ABC transporter permease [Acetohalobium arabaticum]|uniref:Binding-protein-dependent transport systems inner membrane component n=1 Tax=Acetohalobium arabaticum (strain ATCC 49924 / DSM 5501 / Z-7288) TaxID=574087 RepID=D9QQS0_ACEAZ|nr:ABC transporter permease [Acetohalobium arabaticum]ADL12861.1 binding-protein-dependent transport systems inner membrane component [Acetohalobium arabaticum DSM 5501]